MANLIGKIQSIETDRMSMLNRINEIQQRISNIEDNFGVGNISGDFQTTLAREIERQNQIAEQVQNVIPIEEYLAANKVEPVNEEELLEAARVAVGLYDIEIPEVEDISYADIEDDVEIFEPYDYEEDSIRITPERNTSYRAENSTEEMIEIAADKYGLDAALVRAVGMAESDLNQNEISPVGAIGVMQLMPETAANLGVDPYDKRQNIEGGAHYLRQMIDTFNGNLQYAIAAYNAGPGAVKKYGGIPPYSETQAYVGRVLDFYAR